MSRNETIALINNAQRVTNVGKERGRYVCRPTSLKLDQTKQPSRGERSLQCKMPFFFHTLFIDLPNPRGISWKFHRDSKVHLGR